MRIATYNVEWFDALFDDDGGLLEDDEWSNRYDVTRQDQIAALGVVFTALDADAVMIIEAPDNNQRRSTVRALEGFAQAFNLRARKVLLGFSNDTQQEIALLYDPDALHVTHDAIGPENDGAGSAQAPRFDGRFHIDLDIDATTDRVAFSKPPLEIQVQTAAGTRFRLIGVHLKSKAPHGASNKEDAMQMAIANRRKQLAQAIWLRQRISAHLEMGQALIVLGDLNDGPGLDEYEKLFGRSSVEILLGEGESAAHQLHDPHARRLLGQKTGAIQTTSRFYLAHEKIYMQALLDYIMISPDLQARGPGWRIWHPFDDPECWKRPALCKALLTASDHFPVSLDIDL